MSTTILYHACIAIICDHEKRLVDDCRECEALTERAHEDVREYWLAHSGGFYFNE